MAQAERELLRQVMRLFFSLLLLAPLGGDAVAGVTGYHVFLLADARIQSVLAGLLLLWTLVVNLAGWIRRQHPAYLWVEAAVWLVCALLFGYSLHQTYFAPVAAGRPVVFYLDVAALAAVLQGVRLVRAYRQMRRAAIEE